MGIYNEWNTTLQPYIYKASPVNTSHTLLHNSTKGVERTIKLLVHQVGRITAIIQHHIWLPFIWRNALLYAPPEVLLRLSLPCKDGEA